MKQVSITLLGAILLCGALFAQDALSSTPQTTAPQPPQASPNGEPRSTPAASGSAPSAQTPPNQLKIAPGSVIPVELSKTLDAKKAKTGEEVVATVTQDMKTTTGEVLVPKDTKIIGHVTEAQPHNKQQKESELGIAFDHAVVKGDQVSLPMSIQAVIAPQTSSAASSGGGNETGTASGSSPSSSMPAGRSGAMGGSSQASSPQNPPAPGSSESEPQTSARPPITGKTQGVIGLPDVKLDTTAQNSAQGSVMSSEKNNVKIEKGTMLLLRVSQ